MPVRKKIRLEGFDYSQAGHYFITVCVKDMHEMLGKVVGGGVLDVPRCDLTEMGRIVNHRIQEMNSVYDNIQVDKYIIMPNHIHIIIRIAFGDTSPGTPINGSSRTPTPTNAAIPRFVSTLKRYTNKDCGFSFWQRSYHDHIIRNEVEYHKIWQYIDENPARWDKDKYYTNPPR